MFESHEFHLSMQSLDPVSRDTSFCKYIYRKDKTAGKDLAQPKPSRKNMMDRADCSASSFDHFEALDKWINFPALLFHNPQNKLNTTYLKTGLRYKWHRRHLSHLSQSAAPQPSSQGNSLWETSTTTALTHTAFFILSFNFFKFKFLSVIEQEILPWLSPSWTILLLILYYVALRAYSFCFMGMRKCLHVSCSLFFLAFQLHTVNVICEMSQNHLH